MDAPKAITDAISTGRLAVEVSKGAKPCCLDTIDKWTILALGQQRKCLICENAMKTVHVDAPTEDAGQSDVLKTNYAKRSSHAEGLGAIGIFVMPGAFRNRNEMQAWAECNGIRPFANSDVTAGLKTGQFIPIAKHQDCTEGSVQRFVKFGRHILIEVGKQDKDGRLSVEKKAASKAASVEMTKEGTCPGSHPVKWANRCWSLRAAAAGFPEEAQKQAPVPTSPPTPTPPPTPAPAPAAPAVPGEAEKAIAQRLRELADKIEAGTLTGAAIAAELKQVLSLIPKEK